MWASSREALFAEAALAVVAVMGEGRGDPAERTVELDAPDAAALFVDWLSEVLYLFEVQGFVPQAADVTFDDGRLRATVRGIVATSFNQTGPAVKAVTYHGLEVTDTDARVYLDV